MKVFKLLLLVTLFITSSCGSIQFRFNSQNIATKHQVNQPIVKTYTTAYQTFANLDPWDLGLSFGGNWVHCRTHGFHDLNDWTDFTFSPYFCRPTHGFLSGSSWNSNWGGMNNWNPRFNYLGNMPNRWSPFGYDRWGYNNWMGNVYYGYGYWGNRQYNWYRGRNVYRGRRATNSSGRWESTTPVRRVNTPSRTRTNTTPIRTNVNPRPTRTRTNTTPIRTRTNTTPIRTRPNNNPTRIQPVRRTNNTPVRTRTNSTPTRRTNTVVNKSRKN